MKSIVNYFQVRHEKLDYWARHFLFGQVEMFAGENGEDRWKWKRSLCVVVLYSGGVL